jgi:DNA-binding transcriptional MerR regulator
MQTVVALRRDVRNGLQSRQGTAPRCDGPNIISASLGTAMSTIQRPEEGLKLKEICRRLGVDYDDARYTLAKGVLPDGVAADPGKGNHRIFENRQAFMLAIILRLRAVGVSTAVAKDIAEWSRHVQGMAVNLGWDWNFAPFAGKLHSEKEWYLDVGDSKYARIVTNAHPSKDGYEITPWVNMTTRREQKSARPTIIFRVDIVRIAELLASAKIAE